MATHQPWAMALACIYAAACLYGLVRELDHMTVILFALGAVSCAYVATTK